MPMPIRSAGQLRLIPGSAKPVAARAVVASKMVAGVARCWSSAAPSMATVKQTIAVEKTTLDAVRDAPISCSIGSIRTLHAYSEPRDPIVSRATTSMVVVRRCAAVIAQVGDPLRKPVSHPDDA